MDLPPQQKYDSEKALFASIDAWARARGYAFVLRRSTKEKNGKSTITYACRAHHPPPEKDHPRKTTTRGTGCPFSVTAKESTDGSWNLKHRPNQECAVHNHGPSQHPSALPGSSTTRGPSQFEVAEVQASRAPSRCSQCRGIGHIMTSKACPLRYSDI